MIAKNLGIVHPGNIDRLEHLIVLLPGMLVVGSAFFFILLDRLRFPLWILSNATVVAMLVLIASPLVGTMLDTRGNRNLSALLGAHPPGVGWIRPQAGLDHHRHAMGHGVVWRPCVGVAARTPSPISKPSTTPITIAACSSSPRPSSASPATTLTSGEYKDWLPFVTGTTIPAHFPLDARAPTGNGMIEYYYLGSRNRAVTESSTRHLLHPLDFLAEESLRPAGKTAREDRSCRS